MSERAAHQRRVYVEVTNTLALPYVTGFQRHTRELLARLPRSGDASAVAFIPIVWCNECAGYRLLTEPERVRLARAPSPADAPRSRLARLGDPFPEPARRVARRVAADRRVHRLRESLARSRRQRNHPDEHAALRINRWPTGSFFFDLEAAWHNPAKRPSLLPQLVTDGVLPVALVADVMPELFPEWFEAGARRVFVDFLRAHLRHSVHFVCISECTRLDTVELAARLGLGGALSTSMTTMGADFAPIADTPPPLPTDLRPLRYALCVSTIEPRKNQGLLLDAYDRLRDEHYDLGVVFVGKVGWLTEELIHRIRTHRDLGSRVHWFDRVDDDTLRALYASAHCAVMPSYYEGFGTPVIEALAAGVPTLSSNGGALMEAGGPFAEYFDPRSVDELTGLLRRHLVDVGHHEDRRARLAGYRSPTWDDGASMILDSFVGLAATLPAPTH